MGGRGSSSGAGRRMKGTTASGGIGVAYDVTNRYKNMGMHEFENAIRGEKFEIVGGFDKDGKLVVASTSYNEGSTVVPTGHAGFSKVTTLTHNHPSSPDRPVGGTLSEADVRFLANHSNLTSIRAVANGKAENTYILQQASGKVINRTGLKKAVIAVENFNTMHNMGSKAVSKAEANIGGTLTGAQRTAVYIGGMKNAWANIANKNGLTYTPLKHVSW